MKRNPGKLADKRYDLVVIGGGIHGAFAAWDAVLRGLSVALVEKGDIAGATSANSLKIIHGGLRYLQDADLKRMRESTRERTTFLRIAPHLVHPLPFLVPTRGFGKRSRTAMALALLVNEAIGFDRNRLDDPRKHIPGGRVISRELCRKMLNGISEEELSGGAVWYDCQLFNSERMVLSILRAAASEGLDLANYVEAKGFLTRSGSVRGIEAEDRITGERFEIQCRCVLNAGGPWAPHIMNLLPGKIGSTKLLLVKAMDIIVRRSYFDGHAVGLSCRNNGDSRFYFFVPWREATMIGTYYSPFLGSPDEGRPTDEELERFLRAINEAYPSAELKMDDVSFIHFGLLPAHPGGRNATFTEPAKRALIFDHMEQDNLEGIVSLHGVKYTTARLVAEKAIDRIAKKLGKERMPCRTAVTPVHGGRVESLAGFRNGSDGDGSVCLEPRAINHLMMNYGSEYKSLFTYMENDPEAAKFVGPSHDVIGAEILHGIEEEMAQNLTDLVLRRTDLGTLGHPGDASLEKCASIAASRLGWTDERVREELSAVNRVYEAPRGSAQEWK